MDKLAFLAVGGALGTVVRYYFSGLAHRVMGCHFPWGTMAVNMAGCFLIGFVTAYSERRLDLGPDARLMLTAGFCGAFTTFSTFMLETGNLVADGEMLRASANAGISVFLGFALFRTGEILGMIL